MKTEISRNSHQPKKRYSGVYQQQGRMLTDADWNELVEILKDRLNDALKDVVGNGSPLHRNVIKNDADPPNLQWGCVYADGIQAFIRPDDDATPGPEFEYDHQEDFPSPPTPTGDYILYADLWERTVTYLMDERLREKGLHGADTCTRKQMMAQVKWCSKDFDPELPSGNPTKGNAELSITLPPKSEQPDLCDPCASQTDVESKVGNYLFRMEVHEVKWDWDENGPTEITEMTLKWSSENAAEQVALNLKDASDKIIEPPKAFSDDRWAFEFFDEISERHLGMHLAPDFIPSTGKLVRDYPSDTSSLKYARRWDGFCKLKKNGDWTVIDQFDRIKSGPESIPFTEITDGKLSVTLDVQNLVLTLSDRLFVAGDYWLADVREAKHKTGDSLITEETPHGIEHHYLTLGTMVDGKLKLNPEADRKYAFPPLTEMTRMFSAGGDGQEAMPNQFVPQPLKVGVTNGQWPVAGAKVEFSVTKGNGKLVEFPGFTLEEYTSSNPNPTSRIATTDGKTHNGLVICKWKLGSRGTTEEKRKQQVTVRIIDPASDPGDEDYPRYLDHPPIHFYANLSTADQVAYEPKCPGTGQNTVHSYLANDDPVALNLGTDGYYTVKEVLDALLCKLKAKHIPYDPNIELARWEDIKEKDDNPSFVVPKPIQAAIDDLIVWLESTDINYEVHDCSSSQKPTVRSLLIEPSDIGDDNMMKIDKVFDKLLCEFKATHLPLDKTKINQCDKLKDAQVKTVQDAINAICCQERGGCTVTVGKGGDHPDLTSAFASKELKNEPQINICLLPLTDKGKHTIGEYKVPVKESISITGHDTVIKVHGQLSLVAGNVTLRGIHFSAVDDNKSKKTGSIALSSSNGGNVVVEHCRFSRIFKGKATWVPLVTVGKRTTLKWTENDMSALRQHKKIREASTIERTKIPETSLKAYDDLEKIWGMDPYKDPEVFRAKATAVAEKISVLPSPTRKEWYAKRPIELIKGLLPDPVRILLPGSEIGRLKPMPGRVTPGPLPGRGDVEPMPGRVTPRSLAEVSATIGGMTVAFEVSPKIEVDNFFNFLISAEALDVDALAEAIHTVAVLINIPDYALTLESNNVGGWITNNNILGYVALRFEKGAAQLSWLSIKYKKMAKEILPNKLLANNQLSLHGNIFTAVHSMIPDATQKAIIKLLGSGAELNVNIRAYESMTIGDNIFYEDRNSFISNFLNMNGNHFHYQNINGATLAYTMGTRGIFLGNISYATKENNYEKYKIKQTFNESVKQPALNLLTIE